MLENPSEFEDEDEDIPDAIAFKTLSDLLMTLGKVKLNLPK